MKKKIGTKIPQEFIFQRLTLSNNPEDDIDFDVKKSQYFLFILISKKFIIKNYADHSL